MKAKQLLSILLLAAMLVSCADAGNGTTDETTPSNKVTAESAAPEETELTDSLPEGINLQGESVNFLTDNYNATYSPLFAEEETGEILNDAKFRMMLTVEERLNTDLTETLSPDVWATDAEIKQLITAGDTTYDIMTNMDRFIIANVQDGLFYAVSDLPYVDLSAVYWNPSTTDLFKVGEKAFMAMSSFSLYNVMITNVVMMDISMADNLGLPNMYETVMDGKWTYDLMASLAEKAYADTNGNGVTDVGDTFGLLMEDWCTASTAVVSCGANTEVMSRNADGDLTYNVTEHLYNVLEKVYNLFQQKPYVQALTDYPFAPGQALFSEGKLKSLDTVRDADTEYTVLPTPKYSEEQSKYYCHTCDSYFTLAPVTCQNLNAVGAVLEAMACEGYKNVVPTYAETVLQKKYAVNQETSELIRMCINNRTLFLAEMFMFDQWGDGSLATYLRGTNASPASFIGKLEKRTIKLVEDINEIFQDLNS